MVGRLRDETFESADFAHGFKLGRNEPGVLKNPVGDAQVFGDERIVVELERPSGAWQVIELSARNSFLQPLFNQKIEHMHSILAT